jgi:hypothetical protein
MIYKSYVAFLFVQEIIFIKFNYVLLNLFIVQDIFIVLF